MNVINVINKYMRRKIFYTAIALVVIGFCALLYFFNTQIPKILAKCPEDYPETEAGLAERKIAIDEWIADFRRRSPNGSISEFAKLRYQFYVDNDCSATLEKYFEMEATETETEEDKIIRETIQEEINNQAMKNLINSLKE